MPLISVIVPTFNRPKGAYNAALSVLLQGDSGSVELIVSNNGANPITRDLIKGIGSSHVIRYYEHHDVMPMPQHWEWASMQASGDYILFLADRRLLLAGSLSLLQDLITKYSDADAIIYDEIWLYDSGVTSSTSVPSSPQLIGSSHILKTIICHEYDYRVLPIGVKSAVKRSAIDQFRNKYNRPFYSSISPDFSSAFNLLLTTQNVCVANQQLMLTYGFAGSNGGAASIGDNSYLKSLGGDGQFSFVPASLYGNVWASIVEDFCRAVNLCAKGNNKNKMITSALSNNTILAFIYSEEMLKMVSGGFSSMNRFILNRKYLYRLGMLGSDEIKAFKRLIRLLPTIAPLKAKQLYRLVRSACNRKDLSSVPLLVAGFSEDDIKKFLKC